MPDTPALPPFKVIADELATGIERLNIRQSHYYLLLADEVSLRLHPDDIKRNCTYDLKVEMLGKYLPHKSTNELVKVLRVTTRTASDQGGVDARFGCEFIDKNHAVVFSLFMGQSPDLAIVSYRGGATQTVKVGPGLSQWFRQFASTLYGGKVSL